MSEALSSGANSSGDHRLRNRDLRNAGSCRAWLEQTHAWNRVGQPHLNESGGIRSLASIARDLLPRLGPPPPVALGRRTESRDATESEDREGTGCTPEAFHLGPRPL